LIEQGAGKSFGPLKTSNKVTLLAVLSWFLVLFLGKFGQENWW
jgi:hypothetical protein